MHTDAQEREEFLKVDELAAEWRQHPATIYRKVAAGEIPSVRLGGESAALRIPRSALAKVYEASASGRFPSFSPADPCRARPGPGCRRAVDLGRSARG